ncbi:hypothetical protein ACFQ5D_05045 [Paenibacillus farraposensis]|uniref:Uncharacterized protein n=1 Tax=Paenibacillus farraposensis TaxID=2807095 RepID=A0ABW4D7W0_9BACL|nr:hypothetical protein [Paenibacillus farraposensis]MCC3379013.1 hypothetical protein [Paenibacillus farraposensis]
MNEVSPNVGWWQSSPEISTKGIAYIGYDFGFSVSSVIVQKLNDGQWKDVGTYDLKLQDTTVIKLPQPITAQGWRLMANSDSSEWAVIEVDLGLQDNPTQHETPTQHEEPSDNRAILVVAMTTGLEKEYDLPMSDVNTFLNWYDARGAGTGPAKFEINKYSNNKGPFSKRKDYVIFNKILTFEVSEYSTK